MTTADAIRDVTTTMQTELAAGRRSAHIDAHDLVDLLLAIADRLDAAEAAAAYDDSGCEFCAIGHNRPSLQAGETWTCRYCDKVW